MLLAVAGLDKQEIGRHTRALAEGDWSRFNPAEQVALNFARKLTRRPALPIQDYKEVVSHLGRERTLDVVWWVCHCHYMTCVADAFQLPLEEGNVFDGFLAESPLDRKR